jgi:hypothetical protein
LINNILDDLLDGGGILAGKRVRGGCCRLPIGKGHAAFIVVTLHDFLDVLYRDRVRCGQKERFKDALEVEFHGKNELG